MNRWSRTLDDLIEVETSPDLTLLAGQSRPGEYPTSKIQRGLVISQEGEELCEEGVGFGVPVLKFGDAAAFPGWSRSRVRKEGNMAFVETEYEMNLVSRLAVGGGLVQRDRLCRAKGKIDRLHRDHPSLRRTIEIGSALFRRALSVETRLVEADLFGRSRVRYAISERGEIDVRVRCWPKREGCTEMAVMNEQGAGSFDRYRDSEGLDLSGDEIGSWERTAADWAEFIDAEHDLSFKLLRTGGAELFYGREMRPGRLAWAGFAYVVPVPGRRDFEYRIELGRSP
ncbi:hypothetical protein [Methanocrinis sp.]|uniref:hypothetical protein n=1 Tax=Methanocrinis sp. TaxID=3101522 RepID=UPI003D0F0087